ncbi:MAG TPA: cysteine desulfurase family protein [Rhabdochlamydiaceae bacterium]|nr:cysteine desulfurase family protein [Rhabdochlamydiaceae bacterium]
MNRIYLDNNATTSLDHRVLDAMLQDLRPIPANPSSIHFYGQEAKQKLQHARSLIGNFLGIKPSEIIFTSGGTESLNMLIKGPFLAGRSGHIITSDIEHSSVYNTIKFLEKNGCEVTFLKAGLWGTVKPEQVEGAINKNTSLIILGAVNGETGVKTDIEAIAHIAKNHQIPFVVDAVALLGKELFIIPDGVSAMAFSAHKLHGPKGIGMAYVHSSFKFDPLLIGGDQEYSKRAGTENLAGILGMAQAIDLLRHELPSATHRMQQMRDRLEEGLKKSLGNILINGEGPRVANTSNISFPDIDGEALLINLDLAGIAASHGSACASGALEPSRVLLEMGIDRKIARSSLRFSLSRQTSPEEIERAIKIIEKVVHNLRKSCL